MEITKEEIEHVTGLARIRLGNKEKEKMTSELEAILGYIDKLNEVSTDGVEPSTGGVVGFENVFRKDESSKMAPEDQAADAVKLVEMAPKSKDNFVKVPAVFGE